MTLLRVYFTFVRQLSGCAFLRKCRNGWFRFLRGRLIESLACVVWRDPPGSKFSIQPEFKVCRVNHISHEGKPQVLEADRVNFQFNGYYSLILILQWLRIQTSDGRKTLVHKHRQTR